MLLPVPDSLKGVLFGGKGPLGEFLLGHSVRMRLGFCPAEPRKRGFLRGFILGGPDGGHEKIYEDKCMMKYIL